MQREDMQELLQDKYRVIEQFGVKQKRYESFIVERINSIEDPSLNGKKYIAKIQDLTERKKNHMGKFVIEKKPRSSLVLEGEIQILLDIERMIDKIGFPKAYDVYSLNDRRVIITDLRSMKLTNLVPMIIKNLNTERYMKLCLKILYDLLDRIESIHQANYIHTYLRPTLINFKRQQSQTQTLFISDYSKAHKFNEYNVKKENYHKPYHYVVKPTGKSGYSSIWSHAQITPSRRDDMDSFCYISIYLLSGGRLPWDDIEFGSSEKKIQEIFEKKLTILDSDIFESDEPNKENTFQVIMDFMDAISSRSEITSKVEKSGWKVLKQFKEILIETRNLGFEDEPNYHYIRKLIRNAMNRYGIVETDKYYFPLPDQVLYPKGF